MQIKPFAKIIADSVSPDGIRITTFHLRYWRPIHSEFMTHRKFGRNARSSRAVPNKVLLREPIMEPLSYGMHKPGMSAGAEMTGLRLLAARAVWLGMAQMTRLGVRVLQALGGHKQWINRPLEWFGAIDVLVTATSWNNFWVLRLDKAAQPEMRILAEVMREAFDGHLPRTLKEGEWHLPFITEDERLTMSLEDQKRVSVARCARITHKPFEGAGDIISENARWHRLVGSHPLHASPAEHQATPDRKMTKVGSTVVWMKPYLHGNLDGWLQYRKMLPGECALEAWGATA